MNKGIIMEIKKNYAITLNDEGVIEKIAVKQNMEVGQKIFYFEDDLIKATINAGTRHNNLFKAIGSIAALFLIVFTFFHTMKTETAYAVVSLDINPSIQIEVDSSQKIIKIEGVNIDGKNIDFSDIKDLPIDDGIQKIREKLEEKNYLDNNKDVLVGVAFIQNGEDVAYEEDLIDAIKSTFDTENITYVKGDKKDIDEAKSKGISIGRFEASKVVDEETKKKIDVAPVKEIKASIIDKENVIQWEAKDEKESEVPSASISTKPDIKSEVSSTNKPETSVTNKPEVNAPSDNSNSSINQGDAKNNNSKSAAGNDILQLEPEKPAQNNGNGVTDAPKDSTVSIDPNKGETIENKNTSGKIEENNNTLPVEPSKVEKGIENINVK